MVNPPPPVAPHHESDKNWSKIPSNADTDDVMPLTPKASQAFRRLQVLAISACFQQFNAENVTANTPLLTYCTIHDRHKHRVEHLHSFHNTYRPLCKQQNWGHLANVKSEVGTVTAHLRKA
jgi:hypothetical protein